MIKHLDGKTLSEKQRLYYNGHLCPYCDQKTQYVDSIIVYPESHGMIHYCKDCQAWVGCHNGTDQSYGFVATKYLRGLRHETHQLFDPLWQSKVHYGEKPKTAQVAARKWLAGVLDIPVEVCHIGMFDIEMCRKTIEICQKYHLTPEQREQRQKDADERAGLLLVSAKRVGIEPKFFAIMNMAQYELVHPKGKTFKYKPIQNIGQWDNGKWQKIENIETFITQNFKLPENGK